MKYKNNRSRAESGVSEIVGALIIISLIVLAIAVISAWTNKSPNI